MEAPPAATASRRRPPRKAAARRAQYTRAEARASEHLLRAFAALTSHRGRQPSQLAQAVASALAAAPTPSAQRGAAASPSPDAVAPGAHGGDAAAA
eukprot:7624809-Pyramimonas_sp.AAC.1